MFGFSTFLYVFFGKQYFHSSNRNYILIVQFEKQIRNCLDNFGAGEMKIEKKLGKNENVISELGKRYIRTLETLYPIFENVISEL